MLASGLLRGSFGGVLLRSTLRDSVQRSKTPLHPPAPRVKHSGFALQVRSGKSLPPVLPVLFSTPLPVALLPPLTPFSTDS